MRKPVTVRGLVIGLVAAAMVTGCGVLGAGENAGPEATITFTNGTEHQLVHLVTFDWQTPEEQFADGFPRNGAIPPGEQFETALVPVDDDYNRRPLCQSRNHYFYAVIDPAAEWAPWDNANQSFDDLELIELLETPCWESSNPNYTINGSE